MASTRNHNDSGNKPLPGPFTDRDNVTTVAVGTSVTGFAAAMLHDGRNDAHAKDLKAKALVEDLQAQFNEFLEELDTEIGKTEVEIITMAREHAAAQRDGMLPEEFDKYLAELTQERLAILHNCPLNRGKIKNA